MKEQTVSEIDKYRLLSKLRDQLKRVQQMSWNITQSERKFPFETITPEQEDSLFRLYYEYAMDMFVINKVFGIILKEAKAKDLVPKA
jgi:hypothetical protein